MQWGCAANGGTRAFSNPQPNRPVTTRRMVKTEGGQTIIATTPIKYGYRHRPSYADAEEAKEDLDEELDEISPATSVAKLRR
jgi:hypothetical protein